MNILITNDDGLQSPGLDALVQALSGHDTWVAVPDRERSGASHSITLYDPIRFHQISKTTFICSGTPADCVLFSVQGALPVKPDIILSGINLGPNLGTDIIYSGTAAGARQGALMGYPSVAVSSLVRKSADTPLTIQDFEAPASFIAKNLQLFRDLWDENHFLNINFPEIISSSSRIVITHPTIRMYSDELVSFASPGGDSFYFLKGTHISSLTPEDSDVRAVEEGHISMSPVFLQPVNHEEDKAYKNAQFRSG